MAARPRLYFAALFCLFVSAALYMVGVQPDAVLVTEGYPVGLLAGCWLLAPRRWWPALATGGTVVGFAVYSVLGRDVPVAFGWGLAGAVAALVTVETLTSRGAVRARLMTESDLRRFVVACLAGAVAGATVATVVAALTGFAPVGIVAGGVLVAQMATNLVLLPHFMGRPRFPGLAPVGERITQWIVTVTVTATVFLPYNEWPSLVFAVLPCLGWAALRGPMRETLVQLLVVATLSHAMTMRGMGPFAVEAGENAVRAELLTITYALYISACALVAIPFALAVGIQRRQSWKARQEQARVQRFVQNAAGVAIIGTDARGRIDLFNPGAEAMLGYRSVEVVGRLCSMFHAPREIERLSRRLGCPATFIDVASRIADDDVAALDVEFVRKDGAVLVLQFSMSRIYDEAGRVSGYVSTGEDVTDRVNRQRALEEALAAERVAVENLKEVDQVKDALVSGVSHELRTPITSILGYLEVLEDGGFGELNPQQSNALRRVRGNSNRLLTLIDDLLMLSRIQDGHLVVENDSLDLRTVIETARLAFAPTLTAAGIDFHCRVPDSAVQVKGDAERLGRVLENLLGNAAKFTERFGSVDLELGVEGRTAVITVRDTGIGVPDYEQNQLFDRFFRASTAREREIQGSGLGLSIARALVRSHGGRIDVTSAVGVGSTFRVRLPLEGAVPVPEQDRAARRRTQDASRSSVA